jgi:hypothetical protein
MSNSKKRPNLIEVLKEKKITTNSDLSFFFTIDDLATTEEQKATKRMRFSSTRVDTQQQNKNIETAKAMCNVYNF